MTATIRPCRWADSFYPADPASLRALIRDLHTQAAARHLDLGSSRLRALILPHAGYIFSGLTAAHGTSLLHTRHYKTILLLGPAHHVGVAGCAVSAADTYRTPLGDIPLSDLGATLLADYPHLFQHNIASEQAEHSLEVILPFLQESLKSFNLLPLVVGQADGAATAQALAPLVNDDFLVVVSSDLSHFLDYDEAVARDHQTLQAIIDFDLKALAANDNQACGMAGIRILLHLARAKGWQPQLLHYTNSGDTAGDRSRVVGYGAIAFTEGK